MGKARRWTSSANLLRCANKAGCECDRCFPLYAYGDTTPNTSDASGKEEEVNDTVASLLGIPPLPTQKQLRKKRFAEGRKLTSYEAHELTETRKYRAFVNGFEAQLAAARDDQSNSVYYNLMIGLGNFLTYSWNILVSLCHRSYCWTFLEAIRNRARSKVVPIDTGSDGGYSTTEKETPPSSPQRRGRSRRRSHVVINFREASNYE